MRHPRRQTAALLIMLATPSAACTGWRVTTVPPVELLGAATAPGAVRLGLPDHTRVVLEQPKLIAGDSVRGTSKGALSSVSLHDVTELAVRRFSPGRTLGMVAVGVAGLFAVAAVACASSGCGPNFGSMNLGE